MQQEKIFDANTNQQIGSLNQLSSNMIEKDQNYI